MTEGAIPLPRAAVVARALTVQVAEGRRRPGERLWEEDLAAEFGVSRGTIREALGALVREGLATPAPRRGGVRVIAFSPADIAEIYDIRGALYGLALHRFAAMPEPLREEYAALRASLWCGLPPEAATPADCVAVGGPAVQFILLHCGSARLEESYRRVALQALRLYAPLHYRTPRERRAWYERGVMLATAIRLGDGIAAEAAGRALIEGNKAALMAALAEQPMVAEDLPEPGRRTQRQRG